MNLNKLIMESLKEIDKSDKMKEIIRENLEETIKKIINEIYGPESEFYGLLKDKIKQNLEINIDKINLNSYNEIVKEEIIKITSSEVKKKAREGVNKTISKIFDEDIPREYKFSDLIEDMKDSFEYIDIEDNEKMTLHLSDPDKWSSISFIYIDPEENKGKYICRNKIVVDMKTNEIVSFIWDKKHIEKNDVIEGLYGMNKKLFNLMTKGTKIIFDKGLESKNYDLKYEHDKYINTCV